MNDSRYDQERNMDQQWSYDLNRNRGEDIYGGNYRGENYRDPYKPPFPVPYDDDKERARPLSGFRHADQGAEDITNYGRINQYAQGTADSYRESTDRQKMDEGMGDWWQEERNQPGGYTSIQERAHRQGLHRGKGPKNYTRSDERIREDINDQLTDDPFVDASNVVVTVANGDVTITGIVESRDEKRRAEDLCESVSGVKNVENRLRLERPDIQKENSKRSTYEAQSRLQEKQ